MAKIPSNTLKIVTKQRSLKIAMAIVITVLGPGKFSVLP